MGNRRVQYMTPEFRVSFTVDEDGKPSGISMSAQNGAALGPDLSNVPFGPLAEFARQYGNLTVNTGEYKARGRKPNSESAES